MRVTQNNTSDYEGTIEELKILIEKLLKLDVIMKALNDIRATEKSY